ncbi:hypothetical protein QBC37DRAFT_376989 [Rhypophila decipiens]|uniref:Uncharacterized protein n=1 Tax=Rhypophila decipiens TaxID=261697 RepID=A0AAN6Y5H5_9PEZI|nr:hypothetical protein QBC37DRAFT_376989 [Rhypophila decipiens]
MGPVGENSGYADSPEWQALEGPNHYLDFVIHCAPRLRDEEDSAGNKVVRDLTQNRFLSKQNRGVLIRMRDEWRAGKFENLEVFFQADTEVSKGLGEMGVGREPVEARRNIPGTITLHPVWLKWLATEHGDSYGVRKEEDFKAALTIKTTEDSLGHKILPIDHFVGFTGTILHELFHTHGLGKLSDGDRSKAYGWDNMLKGQNMELPDFFMYLALVVELTDRKIKVNQDGTLPSL